MDSVDAVELRRVRLPLVRPFAAAHGTVTEREVVLVRVGDGWGECGALPEPTYTSEYVDGAWEVLRRDLVPRFLDGAALSEVRGHRMAKAALEMAVLDDRLRAEGRSLASWLRATRDRVPAGIALGFGEPVPDEPYHRVKLKIGPGRDVDVVRAAADCGVPLAVDANGSYGREDVERLLGLDDFGLLFVEQPFPADDLVSHAALASRSTTPVCLDESVTSAASAESALAAGACRVVNVKPARVGGLREAVRVIETVVARSGQVWVGGMLETGLGRAANVALAARPDVAMVGDLSPSSRWWSVDLTAPIEMDADGMLPVPAGPGLGVDVLPDVLARFTTSVEVVKRT